VTADAAGRRGSGGDDVLGRLGGVDLALVRAVVRVAEVGSITGAAKGLGYSQPGLSQRVQTVERALGCRVFDRSSQGVSVTEIGARVLPYARVLLAVAQAMAAEVAAADRPEEEQ
jgi:DNA-binding transcriptional LysR family regulator